MLLGQALKDHDNVFFMLIYDLYDFSVHFCSYIFLNEGRIFGIPFSGGNF